VSLRRLGAAGLAAVSLACATSDAPLRLEPPALDLEAEDYASVLERWTRSEEIFDGLFSVMYAHATLHSPELRRAFIEAFPDAYGRGSEEARRLTLADPDAEAHWEVFLSVSTSDQKWNDLARPDSIWRVTLQTDDGPEVDAKVREVDLNANLRTFYPHVTPFASGYGLEFPLTTLEGEPLIGPSTREIVLRISSALGEARMTWELEPQDPS
jgi:hypothetical protein